MVAPFFIDAQWPTQLRKVGESVFATICKLKISIGTANITSYVSSENKEEDRIEIPGYFLAEWIAENWWPLIWEPKKTDDLDDPEYDTRHRIRYAQTGFVLPDLIFVPSESRVQLACQRRSSEYAEAKFPNSASLFADRSIVEEQLRKFVNMAATVFENIPDSPLAEAWTLIKETDAESSFFCSLMGSLGLNPYEKHDNIERALDTASDFLSREQLLDLCLTARPSNVIASALLAGYLQKDLNLSRSINFSSLTKLSPPKDNNAVPAYRIGHQGANAVRRLFNISDRDIGGGINVFEKLQINPGSRSDLTVQAGDLPVLGAVEKDGDQGKFALTQDGLTSRRFAAARATFLFWTSEDDVRRFITNAITRDQQASRAFAAELLAPVNYIRISAAGGRLRGDQVYDLADQMQVSPAVIRYQAENNGISHN